MNTTYLIDLENVNSGGFEGANNLEESDELIVFYSEKADTLKIPIITALLKTKAAIKFYKSKNGILNAMDFDIVSVLGIVYNTEREFVIVSKDKGFDVVVERYRSFGKANVSRRGIIGAPRPKSDVTDDLLVFSAPEIPEIEPDIFEAEISRAMELSAAAVADKQPGLNEEPGEAPKPEEKPKATKAKPKKVQKTSLQKAEEPAPEQAKEEPKAEEPKAEGPKPEPKKPAAKKKKPAQNGGEMTKAQKGKINQFLNNLMGAKHEQPMTKDELTLIRETAEGSKNKNAFYNALRKRLGNEKGIALYNRVKDDYERIDKFIKDTKK